MDEQLRNEARSQPGVAREYAGQGIVVTWEPAFCIHVAKCIEGLPRVFEPNVRPWISAGAAGADEIAKVVARCPTGALHFRRLDGGPQEPVPDETTVEPRRNGPLFVRGRLTFVDAQGKTVREETRAALCRCGQSRNKPFCDATHRAIGFRTD